jgi:hypothetical protein
MATRRLEMGFEGGTVLRLTVDAAVAEQVTTGLTGTNGGGWRSVEAEEGTFWFDQAELVYVRLPPGEVSGRIGFGGS